MTATETKVAPKIYVASLSDYNAGTLHGAWIDAAQDVDDIDEAVQAMLAKSPENTLCQWDGKPIAEHNNGVCPSGKHQFFPGNAEEWAIHDYEGFQGIQLGEYDSFEKVSTIAKALDEHGAALAAFVRVSDSGDIDDDLVQKFEEAFMGEWESDTAYAEHWAEECQLVEGGDEHPLYNYIDFGRYAHELSLTGFTFVESGEPEFVTYVFMDR